MENRKATEAGQDVTMQKEDFAVLWKTIHLKVTDTNFSSSETLNSKSLSILFRNLGETI